MPEEGPNIGNPLEYIAQGLGMGYEQFTMQQQQQNQIELMGLQQGYNLELMNQQLNNQQLLNEQGHDLQLDMWNKTNAGAQMKHLKNAGLNPALMYKQGGAGGVTGGQTGGSASGGNAGLGMAPQSPQMKLFGAQLRKLQAEARLVEEKATNEAGGVRKNLTEQYNNLVANTNLTKQIEKTEVNKTEEAKYKAALEKLSHETGVKYDFSPIDSFLIKTMSRIGGDIASALGDMDLIGSIIKWLWEDNGRAEMLENLDPSRLQIITDENGNETIIYS